MELKIRDRNFSPYIDKGVEPCKKLKILYPELNWYQIASKFTLLKRKGRKFYGLDDLALLDKLNECCLEEIKDLIELV